MRDPEFVQLRNRFFLGVGIVLLFAIPIMIFLVKTYGTSNVLNKINKDETFVMLIVNKDCENCNLVKDILNDNDVKFVKLNRATNKNYDEITKKIKLENKREEYPVLVYIKDGEMQANLFSIDSKEKVEEFLEFHGINN